MLFLQIAGGIFVGLVLLIVAAFLFIRSQVKKLLAQDAQATPLAVRLNEDLAPDWRSEPNARALIRDVESLGFTPGKAYVIHEMAGIKLLSLFNHPYAAVVYQHPKAGNWIDVVFQGEDGTDLTASSAPSGGEIAHRPDQKKIFMPGASASDVLEAARREAGGSRGVTIDDANFREMFETEYKKDVSWRNSQGGVTLDEFRRVEANMNGKHSEEDIREAFLQAKVSELRQWHQGCLEQFRKDNRKPWELETNDEDHDLFIVPVRTDAAAYIHYLADCGVVVEEQKDRLAKAFPENQDIHTIFQAINNSFHEDLRAKHVGHTEYPVPADIYRYAEAGSRQCDV
jgi:hypothetical protein